MFPNENIHKGTFTSPYGNHINQINHVLVNDRFKNCITDVKTMRRADCDKDHYLVKAKMKVKLQKNVISKQQRSIDIKSLSI